MQVDWLGVWLYSCLLFYLHAVSWAIWLEIVELSRERLEVNSFSGSLVPIWGRDSIKGRLRLSNWLLVVSCLIVPFFHSWRGNGFPLQWHLIFQALWELQLMSS